MSSRRVKAYCSIRTLTLYVLACEKMTSTEGVVVFNDEKEEQRGGDPFDIVSIPAINDDYEKYVDLYVEPLSHITQTGPLVFKWETLGGEKWDSSKTEAEIHYSIIKSSGEATNDTDNVSVINSLPITHFSNIELKMNDKIVTNSSSGNHAYHAYLMQKSSYGKNVKREIMKKTEGYFEEEGDNMNQFELQKDGNNNPINDVFRQKHDMFVTPANDVVSRTQLYLDLTQVPQYYPTDIDYVMTFTRNQEYLDSKKSKKPRIPKYKVGMLVRVKRLGDAFWRGYDGSFNEEVYVISGVETRLDVPMFKLKTIEENEELLGHYYAHELNRVRGDPVYTIEKILRRRGNRSLVKFFGIKKPSWVLTANIQNLNDNGN